MSYSHLTLDDQIAQTEAALKELELKAFGERLNQRINGALLLAAKSKAEQRSLETAVQKHKDEEARYNTASAELRLLLAELVAARPIEEADEEPVALASARLGTKTTVQPASEAVQRAREVMRRAREAEEG